MSYLNPILAMGPPPGTQSDPRAQMINTIALPVLMIIMVYFVMLRPTQKRHKQQEELQKSLKSGDKIVTTSGIVAVVVTVKEKTLTVRSADAKFEITRGAVAEVTERASDSSESKSASS